MGAAPAYGLTDGGIETALEARLGQHLPEFAAFVLLETETGRAALREYVRPFVEAAASAGLPLVLDTPTWRANPDWGARLGYDSSALDRLNTEAVALVREAALAAGAGDVGGSGGPGGPGVHGEPCVHGGPGNHRVHGGPGRARVIVSGCIGPRYDDEAGFGGHFADPEDAERYHGRQVRALAAAGVDRVTAVTMTDPVEALGITAAAQAAGVPVMVSFSVGPDGRLPGVASEGSPAGAAGMSLGQAILVLESASEHYPLGYFVNCAHPAEAALALAADPKGSDAREAVVRRVLGFRLNAARHADEGPGDAPNDFADAVLALRTLAPAACTFGGCCGTDTPHIAALAARLTA